MTFEDLLAALPNARPETPVVVVDSDGGTYELTAAKVDVSEEGAVIAAQLTVAKQ